MDDDAPKPQRHSRPNRIGVLIAIGLVVVLLVLSGVAWWYGRALTHSKLEAALASEPASRQEFIDRLGVFTQWDRYATPNLTEPEWPYVYIHHPHYRGKHRWYKGRSGASAVTAVFLVSSVERPSQHTIDDASDLEGLRDFCVFLGPDEELLGWVEITGDPGLIELHTWARERMKSAD